MPETAALADSDLDDAAWNLDPLVENDGEEGVKRQLTEAAERAEHFAVSGHIWDTAARLVRLGQKKTPRFAGLPSIAGARFVPQSDARIRQQYRLAASPCR